MTAVLAHDLPSEWLAAVRAAAPDLDIRTTAGRPEEIRAIVCAWTAPERLDTFKNLRLIQCSSAGVDLLTLRREIPSAVEIARIVDPAQAAGMSEYVLLHVLRQHRRLAAAQEQFRARRWRIEAPTRACEVEVGILGLGHLGREVAQKLAHVGFLVSGWSRTPKIIPGVSCYTGEYGLSAVLARARHLICLLPLTAATTGLLNRETFRALPRGSFLINVGRGAHLVEEDLLEALDNGQIAEATLDVMIEEPVRPDHPFWSDNRILITPHSSTSASLVEAAAQIAENLRRALHGQSPLNGIDRARAY